MQARFLTIESERCHHPPGITASSRARNRKLQERVTSWRLLPAAVNRGMMLERVGESLLFATLGTTKTGALLATQSLGLCR